MTKEETTEVQEEIKDEVRDEVSEVPVQEEIIEDGPNSDGPSIIKEGPVDETQEQNEVVEEEEKKGPELQINIDLQTELELKLQEFDKDIAIAEANVADLKKQRAEYIYNKNIELIIKQHKTQLLKSKTEEEVRKKLVKADLK